MPNVIYIIILLFISRHTNLYSFVLCLTSYAAAVQSDFMRTYNNTIHVGINGIRIYYSNTILCGGNFVWTSEVHVRKQNVNVSYNLSVCGGWDSRNSQIYCTAVARVILFIIRSKYVKKEAPDFPHGNFRPYYERCERQFDSPNVRNLSN